jgi:GntR family transcriptional regulator, rspAB operon transcriptional repressor
MTTRPLQPSSAPTLAPVGRARERVRVSDRVYDELVSAIRDVRIPPGATLSETDLAQQLHVSRTPVREALSRLVADGLVSVVPQVGTRVERIRLSDVEQARFVREHLELGAYAAACGRPDRDVERLRALLDEQERSHSRGDVDAFFAADEALHQEIFAIGGYPGAWRLMQPMKLQLDRLRRLSLPDPATVRALIDEHSAIVDALAVGDNRTGRVHLRKHVRRVLDYAPRLRVSHPDLFTT